MAVNKTRILNNRKPFLSDIPLSAPTENGSWIRLRSFLADVKSTIEASLVNPDPPDQVQGLTVTSLTFGNLLQWNTVNRSTSYSVYLAIGSNQFKDALAVGWVPKSSDITAIATYFDPSPFHLAKGVTLTYWVVPRNIQLDGPISASVSIQSGAVPLTVQDTWANRGNYNPAKFPEGTFIRYIDASANALYIQRAGAWEYQAGTYSLTQSAIAALVAGLTAHDAGLPLKVTNFAHTLIWDGAALGFEKGDGSNYFIDAPAAPEGRVVGLCDGSTYTYLKHDGTTGSYVTQNLTGHYRKSVTVGADVISAAVAPTSTTPSFSGTTSSEGAAATTVDNTLAGATVAVAAHPHTHAFSGSTSTPVISDTGEPPNYTVLTYFVR